MIASPLTSKEMKMKFLTKSRTLAALEGKLKHAKVLPQISFSESDWHSDSEKTLKLIENNGWATIPLIVRSSAYKEDSSQSSMAGHYESALNIIGLDSLIQAIDKVICSFDESHPQNSIFIQPMIQDASISGVAFSVDPNTGADYIVINYDSQSYDTSSVTSGASNNLEIFYFFKGSNLLCDGWKKNVICLINELEGIFNTNSIDVEFAIDSQNNLLLFQVRRLVTPHKAAEDLAEQREKIHQIEEFIATKSKKHPYLLGDKIAFGIMPDWNPAEIIGARPRALALSLYKELITDSIWAYQRGNYGYRNLRSFPLLVDFLGLPYIDVRVSFNSFIPSDLNEELATKLANYYMNKLIDNPNYHDKVEFEIVFSCYALDLPEKISELKSFGFNQEEISTISDSLKRLTNTIISPEEGLWRRDLQKISELKDRSEKVSDANLDTIDKIYWLLEYCRRYGTLPFAGLARAGFIAVQLLMSLVTVKVITKQEYQMFMESLDTINSKMSMDFMKLSKSDFLIKYGHLRPGTYDILSPRYDENPDRYFDWSANNSLHKTNNKREFSLSLESLNRLNEVLKDNGIEHNSISFLNFIKSAIEGREYSKFVFTKNVSDSLNLLKDLAHQHNLSIDDMSYADIGFIKKFYGSSDSLREALLDNIASGKEKHEWTKRINIPPLITSSKDVWYYDIKTNEANYITLKSAQGHIVTEKSKTSLYNGGILIIENADPGFDWIFSHQISGFITKYGGMNSHMAIRAGELGIPAIIGAGDVLYNKCIKSKVLNIDCANRQVHILQ